MPATKDVGKNIKSLEASPTMRPRRQVLAIALAEARKMGNKNVAPVPKSAKPRPV